MIFESTFTLKPVGKHSVLAVACVETLYTLALCYVVLNVATTHKQDGNNYFGLAIGFTVVAAALAIGGISGCSLNPAVSFGAMVVATFTHGLAALHFFHVYFVVPFVGSALGVICFYAVQKADEYTEMMPAEPEDYLAANQNWHTN